MSAHWVDVASVLTFSRLGLTWIDLAIVLTFVWFGLTGLASGLLRTGITLISFLLGIVLAGLFYHRLANDIGLFVSNQEVLRAVTLLVIWLATAIAGQLLVVLLKQQSSLFSFGGLDRIGGLCLGLVNAFVVVELALVLLVEVHGQSDLIAAGLSSSKLAPYLLRDFDLLLPVLPTEFRHAVEQFVAALG